MNTRAAARCLLLCGFVAFTCTLSAWMCWPTERAGTHPDVSSLYAHLPLSFEANNGQRDAAVKFVSRGQGYTLFLTSTEAVLRLRRPPAMRQQPAKEIEGTGENDSTQGVIRLRPLGANPNPAVTGLEALPGRSNYFIGSDRARWRTGIPQYAKVEFSNVYPGIDLVYYGNQEQLEYDWIVSPGADPGVIRFSVEGVADLSVGSGGDLLLDMSGDVRLKRPVAYQQRAGVRVEVEGRYLLLGGREVAFGLGDYDRSLPLVIDPILSYCGYLGGSDGEEGMSVAVDTSGNAYVTGGTGSTDFPTVGPVQGSHAGNFDIFVAKVNASGTALIYSTYIGGSGPEYGVGIAVDSSGSAYVTGETNSKDFPTMRALQASKPGLDDNDAFALKLSPTGDALVYSTYLGGTSTDEAAAITVDTAGKAYVTGGTSSDNFPSPSPIPPIPAGGTDVFVVCLNASGTGLQYTALIGGSGGETGRGIAVDSAGNAYVTGQTDSSNFPTTGAFQVSLRGDHDAFVAKLDSSGIRVLSTYIGGSGDDSGTSITLDTSGSAYLTGKTGSNDFPTKNPIQARNAGREDIFVAKLTAGLNELMFSTYLGGSDREILAGIAIDSIGNVYVAGLTESTDFPTARAIRASLLGDSDAFVAKLDPAGTSLLWSTYLGGSGIDYASGIAVDKAGSVYVVGSTNTGTLGTPESFRVLYGGGVSDAFLAKLMESVVQISVGATPADCSFRVDGTTYGGAQTFSWDLGSTHTLEAISPQGSGATRRVFAAWSDGGAAAHTITVSSSTTAYTAGFTTQHLVAAASSPPEGGMVAVAPNSPDGYYAEGAQVQLMAMENFGYVFAGWSGGTSGTTNPANLLVSAPLNVIGTFWTTPGLALSAGGAAKYATPGVNADAKTGYAVVRLLTGGMTPYGTAVFSFKQNGVTVSEAGVPASPPTTRARVFIEYRSRVNPVPGRADAGLIDVTTGIAVVNPGTAAADVAYTLRDTAGTTLATGRGTVTAGQHFACFIDQLQVRAGAPDFRLPPDFQTNVQFGTLEVSASQSLSVLALRGTVNQRGEFLITTTPVADLNRAPETRPVYFPQFVDGGGYTTSLVLLNTSSDTEIGNLQVLDNNGEPLVVTPVGGSPTSTFRYSIPAGGAFRFQTDGAAADVKAGWVRLTPVFNETPAGSGVFGYNPAGILVSESGIPATASTTHARVFVDLSRNHSTGLAVANVDSTLAAIEVSAYEADGTTAAGRSLGPIQLAGGGHDSRFVHQLIEGLPAGFTGVLDISSPTPFAALTLRSLNNERGEFLMTTFPIADSDVSAPWPYFPQVADGGGYTTEFILISRAGGWGAGATLVFYSEDGTAWKMDP